MHFEFEQIIALPIVNVFEFHRDPEHLTLLHQDSANLRMIQHDGLLKQGNKLWFEANVARILPVAMGFEHHVYEPPRRFGERLIHGPFKTLTHIHEFDEVEAGTRVRDILEVELPWHYGGEWAMRCFIAPMLSRAFKLRHEALLKLAQAGKLAERTQEHTA